MPYSNYVFVDATVDGISHRNFDTHRSPYLHVRFSQKHLDRRSRCHTSDIWPIDIVVDIQSMNIWPQLHFYPQGFCAVSVHHSEHMNWWCTFSPCTFHWHTTPKRFDFYCPLLHWSCAHHNQNTCWLSQLFCIETYDTLAPQKSWIRKCPNKQSRSHCNVNTQMKRNSLCKIDMLKCLCCSVLDWSNLVWKQFGHSTCFESIWLFSGIVVPNIIEHLRRTPSKRLSTGSTRKSKPYGIIDALCCWYVDKFVSYQHGQFHFGWRMNLVSVCIVELRWCCKTFYRSTIGIHNSSHKSEVRHI